MFPPATSTPFISPDTVQQGNQNLIALILFVLDEFKIAFVILGIIVAILFVQGQIRRLN